MLLADPQVPDIVNGYRIGTAENLEVYTNGLKISTIENPDGTVGEDIKDILKMGHQRLIKERRKELEAVAK